MVRIFLTITREQMDELKNHLLLNGYSVSFETENLIKVDENEMYEVKTILEDRDIEYEFENAAMSPEAIAKILEAYSRLMDYINNHGYGDEMITNIRVSFNNTLVVTLRGHMGELYDAVVWLDEETGELQVKNPETNVNFFDVVKEFDIPKNVIKYIKCGDKSLLYAIEGAEWTDFGWQGNTFYFSYGDFVDNEGEKFNFRIEYRKKSQEFIFFIEYEDDELIYNYGDEDIDKLFEQYLSRAYMTYIEHYVYQLSEKLK